MATENNHDITNEKIIFQAENEISLVFDVPETSDFFDGHFPDFKLLPAVAQFEIITRFAKKYFGTKRFVPHIKRIKFAAPICPNTSVLLSMKENPANSTISYTISDSNDGNKIFSQGIFTTIKE